MKAIIGEKLGMTQIFDDESRIVPVTVIKAGPVRVTQIKTPEKDGYCAIQIAFKELRSKHVNRPQAGHFAKANVAPSKHIVEVRVDDVDAYETRPGDQRRRHLRRRQEGRRDRRLQGQGLCRLDQASQLQGPGRLARCPQGPPCPRRHRCMCHTGPGVQGQADAGPHGWRPDHGHEPRRRPGRRRAAPPHGARRRSRAQGRRRS